LQATKPSYESVRLDLLLSILNASGTCVKIIGTKLNPDKFIYFKILTVKRVSRVLYRCRLSMMTTFAENAPLLHLLTFTNITKLILMLEWRVEYSPYTQRVPYVTIARGGRHPHPISRRATGPQIFDTFSHSPDGASAGYAEADRLSPHCLPSQLNQVSALRP
jgi:hypothetical protein